MNKDPKFEINVVLKALDLYRRKANVLEMNAGYSGAMNDGGACKMKELAMAFEDGLNKKIPSFLEPFVKKIIRETDPEYQKFLELKQRFE